MDIGSFNITHNVKDKISEAHASTKAVFDKIAGRVSSSLSGHVFEKDFVGISESGLETLKQEIDKYIRSIQNIIDRFQENGDLTQAFAGAPLYAAQEFVKAVKTVLKAYVSTMKNEKNEIDEAIRNYRNASSTISQTLYEDKKSIEAQAQAISLDGTDTNK